MAAGRPLNPLTLIHGDESYLVDRAVRDWRLQARPEQMDVEVFDTPARLDGLRHAIAEMPLIDAQRAILVRDAPQLTGAARRGGADPPERLAAILSERAPTTALCLVAHARVAERNPVLAAIKAEGGAVILHVAKKGREVRSWVEGEVAARSLRLGAGCVEHLIRVAGPSLGAIASELDKLVAFSAGQPLSLSQVRQVVAGDAEAGLYDTLNDLLGPVPARGAESIDRLLGEGRSGQYLLAILAGQIRDLILAHSHLHSHGSAAGLAAALGVPEWRADRLARQARMVPPAVAASWLGALHDVDRRVKTGEVAEDDGLRLVILRAAAQVTAVAGRRRP